MSSDKHEAVPYYDMTYEGAYAFGTRRVCKVCDKTIFWTRMPGKEDAGYWRHSFARKKKW